MNQTFKNLSTIARPASAIVFILLLAACGYRSAPKTGGEGATAETASLQGVAAIDTSVYETLAMLPTTPVKDQGHNELCWLYAMTATIESEHAAQGDSVNIGVDYTARQYLTSLAHRYYFARDAHAMTLRGTAPMAVTLLRRFGAMPYDSYHGMGDNSAVAAARSLLSDGSQAAASEGSQDVATSASLSSDCSKPALPLRPVARRLMLAARQQPSFGGYKQVVERLLDESMSPMPLHVYMFGAEYSPVDFAQSVCSPGEWQAVTSFTHHPFGEAFDLEVADNRLHEQFLNLPLDTMMTMIKRSLLDRHPVCWEGDISERGFSWPDGMADLSLPMSRCTQQKRQLMFERRLTTDDHCMALIGLVRRRSDSTLFFVAKNSWGSSNRHHGFMLLSEKYVRMKTVGVCLKVKGF